MFLCISICCLLLFVVCCKEVPLSLVTQFALAGGDCVRPVFYCLSKEFAVTQISFYRLTYNTGILQVLVVLSPNRLANSLYRPQKFQRLLILGILPSIKPAKGLVKASILSFTILIYESAPLRPLKIHQICKAALVSTFTMGFTGS